jgi:BlaI family transcriptional regulator, penicillinase repressor
MYFMTAKRIHRLGDLQLRIMRVLWNQQRANVAEVQAALRDDRLAYTTVATMLRKMEVRGLVRHSEVGRRFVYEAVVTEAMVVRGMADDLVDRIFGGSLSDAVCHLLEHRDVSRQELSRLEELIRNCKKKR